MNETQVTNDRIAPKLNEHYTNVGFKNIKMRSTEFFLR